MKKSLTIVAIALMMAGSSAFACSSCGCESKKADKEKSDCSGCKTEKKQTACNGSQKAEKESTEKSA